MWSIAVLTLLLSSIFVSFKLARSRGRNGSGTIDVSYGLKLYLTEYGESSYKIVVRSPEPGEYGFAKDGFVFDFAVDP